jgi:predicted transcriptional regulator
VGTELSVDSPRSRYDRGATIVPMAVKKLSIALDPDVADAAASAAEVSGQSLSAWLNDAARTRLRVEDGLAAVAEWEAEQGRLTAPERAAADRELDERIGRPLPHSA